MTIHPGIYHIDLKDRITNFNPAAITHHGVHVNGIVGGAGNSRSHGLKVWHHM